MMFEEALFEMSQHPDRSGKADIYNTACRSSSIDHDFRGDNEYIQEDSFRAPHSPPLDLEPTPIRRDAIIVCERLPLTHCYCNEDARRDVQDWISILQASKRGDVNGSQKTADPSDKMNTAEWIGDSNTSAFLIQPSYAFNNESLQIPTLAELPAAASLDPSYSSDSSYPHYYHGFPTEADVDSVQIHRHQDEKWNERYDQLREFYRVHGHSVVPYHYKDHPALAWWVKRQRHQYCLKQAGSHHTLTEEREQMLNALDFVWDTRSATWEQRLQELAHFKMKHGHFNVPYNENSKLLVWVRCQRRQYKLYAAGAKSSLTTDRLNKLNSIGFDWDPTRSVTGYPYVFPVSGNLSL